MYLIWSTFFYSKTQCIWFEIQSKRYRLHWTLIWKVIKPKTKIWPLNLRKKIIKLWDLKFDWSFSLIQISNVNWFVFHIIIPHFDLTFDLFLLNILWIDHWFDFKSWPWKANMIQKLKKNKQCLEYTFPLGYSWKF